MSSTLHYRPAFKGKDLPDALKHAIEKSDWFSNGKGYAINTSMLYFEGLRDAGIDGAQEVLDAINKHGEIELFLTY